MTHLMRKGISPVIATVIIVAVAIAIAVAVAFWMTGIVGLFTRYEKLEIVNAYADWSGGYKTWIIVLQVRNAGSSDATIDEIFINGRPHDAWTSLKDYQYGYITGKVALTATTLANQSEVPTTGLPFINGTDYNNVTVKFVTIDQNKAPILSSYTHKLFDFKNGVPLKAGNDMTIVILIPGPGFSSSFNADFKHGSSIEVKIHTAAGKEYPKEIVLP